MFLNVTLPVRNGAKLLATNAPRVSAFLQAQWPGNYELVIAENGSTDDTGAVAEQLATQLPATRVVCLEQAGRGGALRSVWSNSPAAILSYMDVDLSADLADLPSLVRAVSEAGFMLAVGSRHMRPATTQRGWRRAGLSRGYNALTRSLLALPVRDAQCGFKAMPQRTARVLLPQVRNQQWFFDTELIALAARAGLPIAEIPVTWTEQRDSQVRMLAAIIEMLRGVIRLRGDQRVQAASAWLPRREEERT